MAKKPICFNAVRAIEEIEELQRKVKHQTEEVMRLKEENTDLKIQIYQMILEKKANDEQQTEG